MKKKVWILNHYATNMLKDQAGRHYWFAENLIKRGYEPTIFCSSVRHNSDEIIDLDGKKMIVDTRDKVPFVFVKTLPYTKNGIKRLLNMVSFYKNLFTAAKRYEKSAGAPEVIIASSVHPLTLVAGIKIAKKFGVPCLCEVRDLWPESIVTYGSLKRDGIVAKVLYWGEKWIYKKADQLIFTMAGGKDYIIKKKWDKAQGGPIDLNKVHHINNGVDLEGFLRNREQYKLEDIHLEDENLFKVVYTGSIRTVNKLDQVLDVAKKLRHTNIVFLLWGSGDHVEKIEERIKEENIDNVFYKGRVEKKYIPYINSSADLNIIIGKYDPLYQYGLSLNKMFEYLAAARPILITYKSNYSIIANHKAGIEMEDFDVEKTFDQIMRIRELKEDDYRAYCRNGAAAAEEYDFAS